MAQVSFHNGRRAFVFSLYFGIVPITWLLYAWKDYVNAHRNLPSIYSLGTFCCMLLLVSYVYITEFDPPSY